MVVLAVGVNCRFAALENDLAIIVIEVVVAKGRKDLLMAFPERGSMMRFNLMIIGGAKLN